MRIDVVTLFPDLVQTVADFGVTGRAVDKGLLTLGLWNPRDYTHDRHRTVDDRPYGGGPGMILMAGPLVEAVEAVRAELGRDWPKRQVILLSPRGERLTSSLARELSGLDQMTLLCGHYEGVDERARDLVVDREVSIGDYVLTGGELPAMVLIDCVARHLPGVLGHAQSMEEESFSDGLLEYPQYTRPPVYRDQAVPEVLLSGDHERIASWRKQQSLSRTFEDRPDLADNRKPPQTKE